MNQTVTPIAVAAAEVQQAQEHLRRAHDHAVSAVAEMPRMTVDWFGPASELWRQRADVLRNRIASVEREVQAAWTQSLWVEL